MQAITVANNNIGLENNIVAKEVKGEKAITKLMQKVEQWQKIAEGKIKSYSLDSKEHQIASDCAEEAQAIRKQLACIKKEKLCVFVAYGQSNKIQGVALAKIPRKTYASNIDNMVVNPESIKLIGKTPVQGTGTALVKKIVNRVLQNKNGRKELRALALHSAMPFYEKLGFKTDFKHGGGCNYAEAMVLSQKDMKKLK